MARVPTDRREHVIERGIAVSVVEQIGGRRAELDDPSGDLGQREHQVDGLCQDGAAWHAVVLGLGGILSHGEAAVGTNRRQSDGAVVARAGQHHADGAAVVHIGERSEEVVDGISTAHGAFEGV